MGGILDVGMMFTGSISKDAEGYSVIVTAVDIKTGKLAASYEEKALLEIELKDICSKMPKKMFQPGY